MRHGNRNYGQKLEGDTRRRAGRRDVLLRIGEPRPTSDVCVGLVVQDENGKAEYVVFGGAGAFELRSRDGGKERKVLPLHVEGREIFVKFDSAQISATHPCALGTLLVSGDGAAMVVERICNNGMGDEKKQRLLRLENPTVLDAISNDGDVFCLDKWSLVSRDANGKDTILFEAK